MYSHPTPIGNLILVKQVRDDWLRSSCASYVFEGNLDERVDCWTIALFHSIRNGKTHPLVKEFLVATVLAELNLCPEPLFVSAAHKSVYGSFTQVEERLLVCRVPAGSAFVTQLVFQEAALSLKKICSIFISLTRVLEEFHLCGLCHGALDDDGVVVSKEGKVFLVNFWHISTQESNQYADIVAVINLFSFLVSGADCKTVADLCRRVRDGRANIYRGCLMHFRELESIASSQVPAPYDKIMACLERIPQYQ